MRRWLALLLVLTACSSTSPPAPAPACEGDTIELFDGSLDGWSQAGPGGFDVVDGALRSRGGMGLLWYSERSFTDFTLELSWRVSAEADNSGVFLRFPDPGDDPGVAIEHGFEVQINDNPAGDPQKTGAIYGVRPASATASRPVGDWNTYRLEVTGPRYRIWLNDTLVNDLTNEDTERGQSGHVGLQNHDPVSRVEFRDISLTCSK